MHYVVSKYAKTTTMPLKISWNEGKMTKTIISRIKYYKKSGARLYIPAKLLKDPDFPFVDDDIVKIKLGNPGVILIKPEWWEMLDWGKMKDAFAKLPEDIKEKIRQEGLEPT